MRNLKIFASLVLFGLILTGCDVKINLNSNLNQSEIKIEPKANENLNQENGNLNEASNENLNQTETGNLNQAASTAEQEPVEYDLTLNEENMVMAVKNKETGEAIVDNLKEACGTEVIVYAQPEGKSVIIFKPFDPSSNKPVKELYALNLQTKACQELTIAKELAEFDTLILSPDQTKAVLALEANEANELKLLDLINDSSKSLVTLPEGETLNGGYGGASNHFDIKWLDDKKIQYTVFEDTVKNYPETLPGQIEKVLQVRIVSIE